MERPGESQRHADGIRHASESPAHPVIGKQPDGGLGHGEAIAFAGDPVRAVQRYADARTHCHPIDERNGRLGEAFEQPAQRIFLGQRPDGPPPCCCVPQPVSSRRSPPAQKARSEPRRSPPHRSPDRATRAGKARAMSARMAVVRALSTAGRFKVTNPAARSVPIRMSPPPLRPHCVRLPAVWPALPQVCVFHRLFGCHLCNLGFSCPPYFRAIHDCHVGWKLRDPIPGGLGGIDGATRGKFLMTGKRLAVAAAFCVLAAPGAFAQKAPPVNAGPATAGPPSPPAAPVAPATKGAQWPRLLPDKSPADASRSPGRRRKWSRRTHAAPPCSRASTPWWCPRRPCAKARMRHAGAHEAHQRRQEPAGGAVAAADRHLRHGRDTGPLAGARRAAAGAQASGRAHRPHRDHELLFLPQRLRPGPRPSQRHGKANALESARSSPPAARRPWWSRIGAPPRGRSQRRRRPTRPRPRKPSRRRAAGAIPRRHHNPVPRKPAPSSPASCRRKEASPNQAVGSRPLGRQPRPPPRSSRSTCGRAWPSAFPGSHVPGGGRAAPLALQSAG